MTTARNTDGGRAVGRGCAFDALELGGQAERGLADREEPRAIEAGPKARPPRAARSPSPTASARDVNVLSVKNASV